MYNMSIQNLCGPQPRFFPTYGARYHAKKPPQLAIMLARRHIRPSATTALISNNGAYDQRTPADGEMGDWCVLTLNFQRDVFSISIVPSSLSELSAHCVCTSLPQKRCQNPASTKTDAPSMSVRPEMRSIESAEIGVSSTTTTKAKFARQIRISKKITVEELPSTGPCTPDTLERRFLPSVQKTGS